MSALVTPASTLYVREVARPIRGAGSGAKLVYASDLHLRRKDGARAMVLARTIAAQAPDVILLGGDLVDAPRAHELLAALVQDLAAIAPVLAVSGNHDVFWGERAVRKAVERGGGCFVVEDRVRIATRDGALDVSGDPATLTDATVARVLCGHDPTVFERAADLGVDLVFAGHLHGGQVVLAQRGERLFPGAYFYRYCGLRFERGESTMLVSRGVFDTLPLRFRCPREIIACTVAEPPPTDLYSTHTTRSMLYTAGG